MLVDVTFDDDDGPGQRCDLARVFEDNWPRFNGMRTLVRDELKRRGEYVWASFGTTMTIRRVTRHRGSKSTKTDFDTAMRALSKELAQKSPTAREIEEALKWAWKLGWDSGARVATRASQLMD